MRYDTLKEILSWIKPEVCFRCNKCVSGCPVAKKIDEYRPNRIVKLAYFGHIDELINSELIWYCTQCFTCTERCPMEVAPADVIIALRNVASQNHKTPAPWIRMAKNIVAIGTILPDMGVVTVDKKLLKRKDLDIHKYRITESDRLREYFKMSKIPISLGEE